MVNPFDASFEELQGSDLRLPVENSPWAIRTLLDEIDCRAEGCDYCCRHYKRVQVTQADIDRIRDHAGVDIGPLVATNAQGVMQFDITGGCRFLSPEGCSIYRHRPDGCYFAPLQFGHNFGPGGQERDRHLYVRIECRPALEAVRHVIRRASRVNPYGRPAGRPIST